MPQCNVKDPTHANLTTLHNSALFITISISSKWIPCLHDMTWHDIQNVLVGLEMHLSFIFQVPNCLGSHKDVCRIATAMGCATLNAPMFGFGFLLYQSTLCWIFFRLAYALTHLTGFSSIQNYWTPVIPKKVDPSLRCTGEGINTHLHWVCKICHTNSAARNNFFLS